MCIRDRTPATKATARSAARTPVTGASVVAGRGQSQTLHDGAAFLGGEAPLHRRARGPRGPTRRRRRRVQLDELETQATQRVHLVEVLAALRPARHRETRGPVAQPHRAVGDVLVLAAGAAGAEGIHLALGEEGGVALRDVDGRAHAFGGGAAGAAAAKAYHPS